MDAPLSSGGSPGDSPGSFREEPAPPRDRAVTPASGGRPRSIGRRMIGHWWKILLIWLVVSNLVMYAIYSLIAPKYEAFGILAFGSELPDLFGERIRTVMTPDNFYSYLETEVARLESDRVLDPAIADSRIASYRLVNQSEDPKAALRDALQVKILDGTRLIRLAVESEDPHEAAALVNSVIESYRDCKQVYNHGSINEIKSHWQSQVKKLNDEIEAKKLALKEVMAVETARLRKIGLTREFGTTEVEPTARPGDSIDATLLKEEIMGRLRSRDLLERRLAQWVFEAETGMRVETDPASVPRAPSNNSRGTWMAAAPVAVLFLVVSLFLVREAHVGRVASRRADAP